MQSVDDLLRRADQHAFLGRFHEILVRDHAGLGLAVPRGAVGVHEGQLADPGRDRGVALAWRIGDIQRSGDGGAGGVPVPSGFLQRIAIDP